MSDSVISPVIVIPPTVWVGKKLVRRVPEWGGGRPKVNVWRDARSGDVMNSSNQVNIIESVCGSVVLMAC